MPTPSPIPADLWARLAALDRRCEIVMVRNKPGSKTPFHGHARNWVVTIRLYEELGRHQLQSFGLDLATALSEAIEEAERRGWHLPA